MHFTREEKHGHSANSATEQSSFFLLLSEKEAGRRSGKGFDERQEDVRCIRGVTQATCLWLSARWYGMSPSSSGATLSISAWFSRLEGERERDLVQEKAESRASTLSGSQ